MTRICRPPFFQHYFHTLVLIQLLNLYSYGWIKPNPDLTLISSFLILPIFDHSSFFSINQSPQLLGHPWFSLLPLRSNTCHCGFRQNFQLFFSYYLFRQWGTINKSLLYLLQFYVWAGHCNLDRHTNSQISIINSNKVWITLTSSSRFIHSIKTPSSIIAYFLLENQYYNYFLSSMNLWFVYYKKC